MGGFKLRTRRGSIPPPVTTINFGVKTRSGFGGWPSGNAAGSLITGTGSGDWVIDAEGNLTPSGSYAAYMSFGASSYSLTLANGLSISITMVANRSDIRFRPTGDSNTNWQLRTVLGIAGGANGALAKGDSVVVRSSEMSDTAVWRYRPPDDTNGSWTDPNVGSGVVTVISEDVDATAAKRHGAILHRVRLETNVSGPIYVPLLFKSVQFRGESAGALSEYSGNAATDAWGVSYENIRCYSTVDGNDAALVDGVWVQGAADGNVTYCIDSLFENIGFAITVKATSTGGVGTSTEIKRNRFNECWQDRIKISKQNATQPTSSEMDIELNVSLVPNHRPSPTYDDHVELFQTDGMQFSASLSLPFGTFQKNGWFVPVEDGEMNGQGCFNDDNAATNYWTDAIIQNFIYCAFSDSAVFLNRFNDPTVRYCTLLPNLGGSPNNPKVRVPTAAGGTDGTFTYNVWVIAPDISAQGGTIDTTGNVLLTKSEVAIQVAFPNWSNSNADIVTPDDFLLAHTPANLAVASGGVVNPGGLVAGALFPAVAPETIGAWNDGTAYDPGNPVWVAAHPPASFEVG